MTGTAPVARSSPIMRAQRRRIELTAAVGRHEPQRVATDAGLVRDLEPGDVAFPRSIERHGTRERACTFGGETRMRRGQRAEQRRVIGLGSAGRKMSGDAVGEAGAAPDRANHVALELDGHGRGGGTRELRIE